MKGNKEDSGRGKAVESGGLDAALRRERDVGKEMQFNVWRCMCFGPPVHESHYSTADAGNQVSYYPTSMRPHVSDH